MNDVQKEWERIKKMNQGTPEYWFEGFTFGVEIELYQKGISDARTRAQKLSDSV